MSECIRWKMQSLEPIKTEPPIMCTKESAEAIKEVQQQGYTEGHAKGYTEGHAKGYSEGMATGYEQGHRQGFDIGCREGEEASARMLEITENFSQELQRADEQIAQDLLDLALDIAKAMLKTSLPVRRDLLLGLVSEFIRESYGEQSSVQLHLNPADVDLVKGETSKPLADLDWQIVANDKIERGGCLVETKTTQIDASLPTRWRRIALALGRESEWLAT
jgi:flagellar assembly protein FliH